MNGVLFRVLMSIVLIPLSIALFHHLVRQPGEGGRLGIRPDLDRCLHRGIYDLLLDRRLA